MMRSMRTVFLAGACFVLFVCLSIAIQRWTVYPQFQALESREVQRDTDQLRAAFDRETRALASFVADYAVWDDAWDYVQSCTPAFIEGNFDASAFARDNFQLVWIVRADGAVLFRASYDAASAQLERAELEAGERILEGHAFLRPLGGTPVSGIVPTPLGPAIVAAHPILTSKGEGPPRGVLVMGRLVDDAFRTHLAEQVRLPLTVQPVRRRNASIQAGVPLRRRLPDGEVETTLVWNDWYGQPAVVARLRSPPDITATGRRALTQATLAVLGQGVLFLVIGGLIAHRSLRRSQQAEIARQLSERTATLRETEGYLQTIMDTVPAGIVIVDAVSHAILDANPAALGLVNGRREDVVGHVCHTFICPAEKGQCPITDLGRVCDRTERMLLRTDGATVPVLKTVVPTHLRGRACLLEFFVDIRDRKAADERIRQTLADLERMNKAMTGREERLLDLKREVNELLRELGRTPRYREGDNPSETPA